MPRHENVDRRPPYAALDSSPLHCWQSDMSDGLWLPDPADPGKNRKCYLHGFIDDHSRLPTHVQFYWRESLPALENCFRRAITKGCRSFGTTLACYAEIAHGTSVLGWPRRRKGMTAA